MGAENQTSHRAFSKELLPAFDGQSSFAAYKQDIEIGLILTNLTAAKQGAARIGRLSGEAKSAAKTLGTPVIGGISGTDSIIEHLEKAYGVDAVDQLDIDLASFLDFTWKGNLAVEEDLAGFHSRLDKISDLAISDKLKGHLLLRQGGLDDQTRNMIVGAKKSKIRFTWDY